MYTLTLQDIYENDNLRELGALAGDQVNKDNVLVRKFSSPEDVIDLGYKITQEDIDDTPNLQNIGAEAGDRISKNNTLIKSKTASSFTQFKYGFDETNNLLEMTGDIALANKVISGDENFRDSGGYRFTTIPGLSLINFGYKNKKADEIYGEGFSSASSEQRREMIQRKRERDLQLEFGPYFEPESGFARGSGSVTKMLADPTNLTPVGQGKVGMTLIGGGLGMTYAVAEGLSKEGTVDPTELAKMATIGAVAPHAVQQLVKGGKKVVDKVALRNAEKTVDRAQRLIDIKVNQGFAIDDIGETLKSVGMSPEKVKKSLDMTAREIKLPNNYSPVLERATTDLITNNNGVLQKIASGADNFFGVVSTRLKNIDVPIFGMVRKYEFENGLQTQEGIKKVESFLKTFTALNSNVKNRIGLHLANAELEAAEGLMKGVSVDLHDSFINTVKPLLNELKDDLKSSGYKFSEIENYYPRLVKDYDGLLSSLNIEKKGIFTKELEKFARRKKKEVSELTYDEKTDILNMFLSGKKTAGSGNKLRFVQSRKFDKITPDEFKKFYASPEEALNSYIVSAISNINKRKLFGKNTKFEDGRLDTKGSIGSFVKDAEARGVNAIDQSELQDLLEARFIHGEAKMGAFAALIRDTGYLGTIANPLSAVTQLADSAITGGLKGLNNTVFTMLGSKNMKQRDIGIENIISKEYGSGGSFMGEVLRKSLKVAFFQKADRLGKETLINASLKKAQKDLSTPNPTLKQKEINKFKKEHGQIYGDEFDALVADLQAGRITDNTKLFAFNALADVQPIALSEMPAPYLRNPNGRVLYMLKSFTIKQYDVVRKEVIQKYQNATTNSEKLEAIRTAGALGLYLLAANTGVKITKDLMLGREVKPEDLPETALWGLLSVYGFNKYGTDRYLKRGDIYGYVTNQLVPPAVIPEGVGAAITEATKGEYEEKDFGKALSKVPIVGRLYYSWFGGGAEEYNERKERERLRQ